MAWTTPRTWVVGELVTADMMNTHVRDNLNYLNTIFGPWTDVAFNAANFTGDTAMTWTLTSGDVITNKYLIFGKSIAWQFKAQTTTVGGSVSNRLLVTIPTGTFKGIMTGHAWVYDGAPGVGPTGAYLENFNSTQISIIMNSQLSYSANTNGTYAQFDLLAELN